MYALCDVNSMYASCEKVFDPSIRNRPVVVLTNNDGCICAACNIAKQMGVGKKFVPFFEVREQLEAVNAVIRSSNYELYAELSDRMMTICSRFAPHIHIYSIDECFLYYGLHSTYVPPEGWQQHASNIRRAVWRGVRLPIGVGIGATPTLAKAANHAAKKIAGYRGVAVIDNEGTRKSILAKMAVTDVWGIGRRIGVRLNDLGIMNALQLANAKPGIIRKQFSVLVESTVYELNGVVKLNWDEVRAPKKEIYSTRSFGQRIMDPQQLKFALATHAEIAAAKLRKQDSTAKAMTIFAASSPHDVDDYYKRSVFHKFEVPTSDSRLFVAACSEALSSIYRKGVRFYRCGVGLLDIADNKSVQFDLFNPSRDDPKLMQCLDLINSKYGRGTLHLAGQGIEQKFAMRREYLSPQYTTRWSDIPRIKCV
ncbi:DNA polymerase V subunit UmuC ['Osedax' symbiont bacterium Rs2_46_30_T18]|nr:DNA polymerase V subunit UmuC ['Osedax' symbiont bacterium Rs2_46_30_T18]